MPIDYSEYPKNWLTEIRPAVLARAKNCCEFCGAPNHTMIVRPHKGKSDWVLYDSFYDFTSVKATTIVLTIAHLDHDKHNHEISLERLKALCQRCHLLYDMHRHVANRKYGRNHSKVNYKLDL